MDGLIDFGVPLISGSNSSFRLNFNIAGCACQSENAFDFAIHSPVSIEFQS